MSENSKPPLWVGLCENALLAPALGDGGGHRIVGVRRRDGLKKARLAEAANLSKDVIARIEAGATGARFPSIERLSQALNVDPAELFTPDLPKGQVGRAKFTNLTARLTKLSDPELDWVDAILAAALRPKP